MRRLGSATLLLAFLLAVDAAGAQYPPGYRWRTIDTEHFFIHYHQGEEDLARRAATIAESAHDRVTPLFNWEPSQKTHIVLTDHVDASNGSATPFPFNHIEVWVSAPGADPASPLDYYDHWLNLVITHEYAHIVHLDMALGFSKGLRQVFGRNPVAFPNTFSPLWMIEGIATVAESEATESGRLKGTYLDMVLRTAAIENRFATEPQASGLTGEWPLGNARYYYGAAFLSSLAREKGPDKLAEYFHNFAANVIPYRVNASARQVFDEDMAALWNRWSARAQSGYRADGDRIAAEGLTPRERLTSFGYETMYPALSPDGRLLAYGQRDAYGWPRIRVRDLQSSKDALTLRVNSTSPLSWSPDGKTVVFSQLEFSRTFSVLSDLYLWDLRAGGVRRLTNGKRLKDPSFAPDGGSVVAVENRAGRNRLVSVDIRSGALRPLFDPGDFRQFSETSFSPDGHTIAVAEWRNGRIDVVLYDREGKRLRNLTEMLPMSVNASPKFSADGATVWFSSDVTGVTNIFSVAAAGGTPARRSNVYGGAFFPTTRDGRTIYYSDYSAEGFDIARFEAGPEYATVPRVIPRSVIGATRGPEPLAVPEPAEAVSDRPYSPARSVLPRWWFPFIAGASGANDEALVGIITSGTDALGFHRYEAQVAARIRESEGTQGDYSLAYYYDRWYPTITLAGDLYTDSASVTVVSGAQSEQYEERVQRTVAQATFPLSHYAWQGSLTIGALAERVEPNTQFDLSSEALASAGLFEGTLHGPRAALYFNTAREFARSISPENGLTTFLDFESLDGERSVQQVRADVRGFLSVPVSRSPLGRHVAAARVALGSTSGDFLLERELKVGGVGSEGLLSTGTTHFPVRGFSSGTLRGSDAALVSVEYRFPLYEIDRGPAIWPIFFHRLSADVFYDTGTAWNPEPVDLPAVRRPESSAFDSDRTISSAGAEISLDLYLGFYVPLRYRMGAAYVLKAPRCPAAECGSEGDVEWYVALGRSF